MSADRRTRWGYNQLADSWAARLVRAADVRRGDLVLDVGAGRGALTARLLSAGARVVAVELHPGRARFLRSRFHGHPVVVVQADATDLRLPRRPFRVVANPPFGITTALLRRLLMPNTRLLSADLVVPVQVAARWAAGRAPGAGRWDRTFSARMALRLPAQAFRPPTPVATAVLRIERRPPAVRAPGGGPFSSPAADRTSFSQRPSLGNRSAMRCSGGLASGGGVVESSMARARDREEDGPRDSVYWP